MIDRSLTDSSFTRLSDSLVNAAESGDIGIPRFVRWLGRVEPDESVSELLNASLAVCENVFGSSPESIHQNGDVESHATIHAQWSNGSSALISIGPAGKGSASLPEVMILGSSGAAYFDGATGGAATVEQAGRE